MQKLSDHEALAIKEARCLSKEGDIAAAERIFQAVLKSNSKNPSIYWIAGYEYSNYAMYTKSIDHFRCAIELDERCVPAWGGLGHVFKALERWDEAEAAFRRRLELSESANHYVFLASVLFEQGRHADTLVCCERALQLDDRQVDALLHQGNVYSLLGLHDKALECCRRAILIDDQYDEAHICLGVVLSGMNELEEASNAFQLAITINPQSASAYRQLGLLQEFKGDRVLAESYLRTADDLDREQSRHGDVTGSRGPGD